MNEINDRVKQIRLALKYNQATFGKTIGLSTSGISNIENGSRSVTEKHIKLLSHELNINEDWLRNGTGEMFVENDSTVFAALSSEYKLDELDQTIIKAYLNFDPSKKELLKALINDMIESASYIKDSETNDIDKQVENYRKELEAEAKGATSSALGKKKESAS